MPIGVDADLGGDDLFLCVGRGDQVLAPVFDPAHRPPERDGSQSDGHLFGRRRDLLPERAPDVRCDYPNVVLGNMSCCRQPPAQQMVALGRRPHGEVVVRRIEGGNATASFEWGGGQPPSMEFRSIHPMGRSENPRSIAEALGRLVNGVRPEIGEQRWRRRVTGRGDVGERNQRLVIDLDQGSAVFGDVAVGGDDDGNRFADIADATFGQRLLRGLEQPVYTDGVDERGVRRQVCRR